MSDEIDDGAEIILRRPDEIPIYTDPLAQQVQAIDFMLRSADEMNNTATRKAALDAIKKLGDFITRKGFRSV